MKRARELILAEKRNCELLLANDEDLVHIFDLLEDEYNHKVADRLCAGLSRGGIGTFHHNRAQIVEAHREKRLYILDDDDLTSSEDLTQEQFVTLTPIDQYRHLHPRRVWGFAALLKTSADVLTTMDMLWIHETWRCKGYARIFVNKLHVVRACATPEAMDFWEHIGFHKTRHWDGDNRWMRVRGYDDDEDDADDDCASGSSQESDEDSDAEGEIENVENPVNI